MSDTSVAGSTATEETPLLGGDVNIGDQVVVRVGGTVRRPVGPHSGAADALLRHFESVGFEGAPRALGRDERGRQMLSYVEGDAALPPVPAGDDLVFELGSLLRRMHDAQDGFALPADAAWHAFPLGPGDGDVVCHHDVFPPNVIFRDCRPAALIDWDLAGPAPRLYDVASAANHWAPLADDRVAAKFGLPTERRGDRLRILCDGYGLGRDERRELLDVVAHRNRMGYEIHRLYGGERRLPGWAAMWDRGSGAVILERCVWFDAHRADLRRSLA